MYILLLPYTAVIQSLASLFRKFTACADRTSGKISVTEKINRNYMINWNNSQYAPVTLKYHGKKVRTVIPRVFLELLYINLSTLRSFCIFLSFLQQSLQSSLCCWQRKISHKICIWKDIFSMLPTKKNSCFYNKEHYTNQLLYATLFILQVQWKTGQNNKNLYDVQVCVALFQN